MPRLFVFLLVLATACNQAGSKPEEASAAMDATPVVYQFDNDTIQQNLTVKWVGVNEVDFSLITHNKLLNCSSKFAGRAVHASPPEEPDSEAASEPDSDLDENGKSYPVVQYD